MDNQRWQHIKAIFEDACERSPAERATFLDTACAGDAALRKEVASLLKAYDDETPFLDEAVVKEAWFKWTKGAGTLPEGTRIGPYRLMRELGQGGMGTVYLAERADGQFQQHVAIKLIRQGTYRTDLRHRFGREQQILASLNHPHIAKLLDGGVMPASVGIEARPYFVMEYVEGRPIDQYCDEDQLSTPKRLALFRTVCDAVQYAHQNLIVHRDLKPSNILVTEATANAEGQVKLLDFGIAKLLGESEVEAGPITQTGLRLLTPEYASPEQVRGEPITTASDVYALGIILYELLTGHRPYEVRGLAPSAIERIICTQDPRKPSTVVMQTIEVEQTGGKKQTLTPATISQARSTQPERLQRRLQGDLDNIVMKALHKDPARRYGSVEQFSEDVRRHLAQLPIVARPDTLGYRVSKFVRRHTMGVLATTLIGLALMGGIIATTYQARVAERRFNQVRTLANTLLFELHDAIRDLPGATPAREMLVSSALTYLDLLNQEAGDDASLQLELAEAYEQVGRIQGDPHYTNLGDLEGALKSYQKAFALREELWKQDSSNVTMQHVLGRSYGRMAVMQSWHGHNEDAIALSTRAINLLKPLVSQPPDDIQIQHDLGRIESELGWWLIWEIQFEEGLSHLDNAVTRLEDLVPRRPDHLHINLDLWRAYSYQVDGLRFSSQFGLALQLLEQKGLPHLQKLNQQYPTQPRVQYGLHICYDYLGMIHEYFGRMEATATALESSLHYAEAMVVTDSANQKAHEAVARSLSSLGRVQAQMGRLDEAVASKKKAITILQTHFTQNPKNRGTGNKEAETRRSLCRILFDAGQLEAALEQCKEAAKIHEGIATIRRKTVLLGNWGYDCAFIARIYRAMAQRAASEAERRQYQQNALRWYDRGVHILNEVKAELSDTEIAWEVNPDTLAGERERLRDRIGRPPK